MSSIELDRLLAEIGEQPAIIERLLTDQAAAVQRVARTIQRRDPAAVVLVARGSSDNAAVYGRYLLEVCNRRLTSLAAPSGLTLYGSGPRLDGTVVIGVSQSGQGEDVVEYVREARRQGAPTVAIVNDAASPLAQTADAVLACQAGPELSVPATKTVTAQMTLLAMLSTALDNADVNQLRALPDAVQAALQHHTGLIQLAGGLASTTLGSVIGRGFAFPVALETALKLKETSYTRAEPFSAADFLHGPVALVERGYSALLIDVGGRSSESARAIATAVRARGGQPEFLRVDGIPEPLAPIAALVLGQLFAVELALAIGIDPARPRGLHKVTSTR